jgi:hypothetical protein
MNKTIDIEPLQTNIYFNWGEIGRGFGQLSVRMTEEGELHCMNELMGKERCRKLLHAYIDHVVDNMVLLEV